MSREDQLRAVRDLFVYLEDLKPGQYDCAEAYNLTENQAWALYLCIVEGHTVMDAAQQMDLAPYRVRNLLRGALRRVRKFSNSKSEAKRGKQNG